MPQSQGTLDPEVFFGQALVFRATLEGVLVAVADVDDVLHAAISPQKIGTAPTGEFPAAVNAQAVKLAISRLKTELNRCYREFPSRKQLNAGRNGWEKKREHVLGIPMRARWVRVEDEQKHAWCQQISRALEALSSDGVSNGRAAVRYCLAELRDLPEVNTFKTDIQDLHRQFEELIARQEKLASLIPHDQLALPRSTSQQLRAAPTTGKPRPGCWPRRRPRRQGSRR